MTGVSSARSSEPALCPSPQGLPFLPFRADPQPPAWCHLPEETARPSRLPLSADRRRMHRTPRPSHTLGRQAPMAPFSGCGNRDPGSCPRLRAAPRVSGISEPSPSSCNTLTPHCTFHGPQILKCVFRETTAQYVNGPSLALQVACGGAASFQTPVPEPASLLTTVGGSNAGSSLPWRLTSQGGGGEMPRWASSQTRAARSSCTGTSGCEPGVRGGRPWAAWGSSSDPGRVLHPAGPAGLGCSYLSGNRTEPGGGCGQELVSGLSDRGAEWPGCLGQSLALPFPGLTRAAASCPWAWVPTCELMWAGG